jgi:hypothetical protein
MKNRGKIFSTEALEGPYLLAFMHVGDFAEREPYAIFLGLATK